MDDTTIVFFGVHDLKQMRSMQKLRCLARKNHLDLHLLAASIPDGKIQRQVKLF